MEIKIIKYEPYPQDNPTGMAVGFQIVSKTDRTFYRDTVIDFREGIEDDEYLDIAWKELKEEIFLKVEKLDKQHKILGATWSPSNGIIVEPEEPVEEVFEETPVDELIEPPLEEEEGVI